MSLEARGIDHFGISVPDLDAAVAFFQETLGAELWYREGPFADAEEDSMWQQMRIHPRSVERLAMLRLGTGATVELLEFSRDGVRSAGAPQELVRHSVAHLALEVDRLEPALERLRRSEGVQLLDGPQTVEAGAAAGLRWIYFVTPWGLLMELIEPPRREAA